MKIALVTTTINVPDVLKEYDIATRYTDNEVKMFVTGDTISPDDQIVTLLSKLDTSSSYLSYKEQDDRWKKLSTIIGPKKIQRRNFSYLMAIKDWSPDAVITIDDDNKPVCKEKFFNEFDRLYDNEYDVNVLKSLNNNKANPFNNNPDKECKVYKRGYSLKDRSDKDSGVILSSIVHNENIGVIEGIALGDPDVDAITRINVPSRIVTDEMNELTKVNYNWSFPFDWVPYNSQCTGFRSELLPYQFLFPFVGRYDDILASYVSQLIMRKMECTVVFGTPYAIQLRNKHNIMKDLKDEVWGMENIDKIIDGVLEPLSLDKKYNCYCDLDDLYFEALNEIKITCPDFDDRNIQAAEEFFNIIKK
jgi:hypothetical protein